MFNHLYIASFFILLGCSKSSSPVQDPVEPPELLPVRVVNVSTVSELMDALSQSVPGDEIRIADGTYKGKFVIPAGRNGTAQRFISLTGSGNVILDAENINTGYVLHLQSSYWRIKGFTITNGLKGLMVDGSRFSEIDGLNIHNIGEEGIHLRKFSSNNIIRNCMITDLGLKTPDYGEGIYIGSAKNNWTVYTLGQPDLCDSNKVLNNYIGPGITAECIDIKEGTTATLISGNTFDATGITGANGGDSWIDVKGNYTKVENNTGINPGGNIFLDGYQTHVAVSGWGNYNTFRNNICAVNGQGYGFNIQLSGSNGTSTGNKVYTSNTVSGAVKGISNIPLSN